MKNFRNLAAFIVCTGFTLLSVTPVKAQTWEERYAHWPEQTTITGTIIVHHEIQDLDNATRWLSRSVGSKRAICFTIGALDTLNSTPHPFEEKVASLIEDEGSFSLVQSSQLQTELIRFALREADIVGLRSSSTSSAGLDALADDCRSFLNRGGILIVDEFFAGQLGRFCLAPKTNPTTDETASRSDQETLPSEVPASMLTDGLNLLPDCVLDFQSKDDSVKANDLPAVLAQQKRIVGLTLEPDTMMVISGRKLFCFGSGSVNVCLPESEIENFKEQRITPMVVDSRFGVAENSLLDLTQWRREAIDRTLAPFPRSNPPVPSVDKGTLLIVGGGGMPKGLMDRFVELAGGAEEAKLVYVPCSEAPSVSPDQRIVQLWKSMGVKHATFIHTKNREIANHDEEFLAPLKDATGIWFGGGRQWNFADSYYGTTAHQLMLQVLQRGGVVGGSSAGASIQAEFLARATPIGNTRILAPGYERGGLGFIAGVAIDQHFTQRGRQKDMSQLKKKYPQLLGIGIDEATAIEVSGTNAKVIGRGEVYFYGQTAAEDTESDEYVALSAGSIYDLASRTTIFDATANQESDSAGTAKDASPVP